ncbi:probable G-protein coupled receptor Mth-like 1 [Ochlerotatus camptorhynchus]|uniref:probable G-protein coupled receptor Mth-like 1 n=1 Tax=Ochlerotatus camptorhynchus TaxID=644619 RepID=UPI0031D88039
MAPTSIIEDDWNSTVFDLWAEDSKEVGNSLWYIVGCLICITLLSIVLILYMIIPNLRCVRGYKTCFFLLGLITAYLGMLAMNLRTMVIPCQVQGYLYAFGIVISVFWLNVLCYDCYALFRSSGGNSAEKNRFAYSCLYGWGGPLALLLFTLFMERAKTVQETLRPNFSTWACYFIPNKTAEFLYFFLPVLLLMIIGIFFLLVGAYQARILHRVPRNVVRFDRSSDHERFLFTLRIFIATALTVTLNLASWVFAEALWLQWTSGICGYIMGVAIFLLCICNPEVTQWLAKRCC